MLSKDTLDRQITLELPARELMFFVGIGVDNNWAAVVQAQGAANTNVGALNLLNLQVNEQTQVVSQS